MNADFQISSGRPEVAEAGIAALGRIRELDEFFPAGDRDKCLNLLLHLVPYNGMLRVTGEAGSGKSTLFDVLRAKAGASWRVCSIEAAHGTDAAALFKAIMAEFLPRGTTPGDPFAAIDSLRKSLQLMRRSALLPLILIDDAHRLTPQALRWLAQLSAALGEENRTATIVLFAEPGLDEVFEENALQDVRDQISHTFVLQPFTEEETGAYLNQRLAGVGVAFDGIFSAPDVKFIHVSSRGVPGRINEFAGVVLRKAAEKSSLPDAPTYTISHNIQWSRYLIAAAIAGVFVFVWSMRNYVGRVAVPAKSEEARVLVPLTVPSLVEPPVASGTDAGHDVEPATAQNIGLGTEGGATSRAPDGGIGEPDPEKVAAISLETPQVPSAAVVANGTEDRSALSKAPDVPAVVSVPSPEPHLPPSPAIEPTAAVMEPEVHMPVAPVPSPESSTAVKNETWLVSQDPGAYTIQLVALDADKVQRFITEHRLGDAVATYPVAAERRRMVAVTYGIYAQRGEALAAADKLAGRITSVKPWVRSLRIIQETIGAHAAEALPAGGGGPPIEAAKGEDWLRAQDPSHFTLQLLVMKAGKVDRFVTDHEIAGRVARYRVLRNGTAAVGLLYGSYATRVEAEAAAQVLRGEIHGIDPWIRPMAAVQRVVSAQVGDDSP